MTVIRHTTKHPTAIRGEDKAMKYRDEIDQKRERDRLIVEAQQEARLERKRKTYSESVRQQGQQAMELMALVDKTERQARGQELRGGEDYVLDTGDMNGEVDKSKRMAERVFAQMFDLNEESVELSVFSTNSDDERSVALADSDHEV